MLLSRSTLLVQSQQEQATMLVASKASSGLILGGTFHATPLLYPLRECTPIAAPIGFAETRSQSRYLDTENTPSLSGSALNIVDTLKTNRPIHVQSSLCFDVDVPPSLVLHSSDYLNLAWLLTCSSNLLTSECLHLLLRSIGKLHACFVFPLTSVKTTLWFAMSDRMPWMPI